MSSGAEMGEHVLVDETATQNLLAGQANPILVWVFTPFYLFIHSFSVCNMWYKDDEEKRRGMVTCGRVYRGRECGRDRRREKGGDRMMSRPRPTPIHRTSTALLLPLFLLVSANGFSEELGICETEMSELKVAEEYRRSRGRRRAGVVWHVHSWLFEYNQGIPKAEVGGFILFFGLHKTKSFDAVKEIRGRG